MFRRDARHRRRWASLAALAVLLAVCLILVGIPTPGGAMPSGRMAGADEGPLPQRPALAREDAMQAALLGMESGPLAAAGPLQAINPGFTVDLTYNALWGLVDPGDEVIVNRTADEAYGAAEADGVGFFWTFLWQTNGQPAAIASGDVLEVYVNGALVDTLSPKTVTGSIDVLADQVAGNIDGAGAGIPVMVTVGAWGSPPSAGAPQETTTTDANGDWSVTFGDVDLGAETLVAVDYGGAGSYVRAYLVPSDPVFLVQQFRQVAGYAPPFQTVTATVYIAHPGDVRWQATGEAGFPHGFYNLTKPGGEDDAQPGDVVEVEFEDGTLLSTTLFDLSHLSFDTVLEQVSGTAPEGELVRASMWQLAGDEVLYSQALATAAPGDTFQASFAPADLRPRDEVTVAIADGQGHQTQLSSGAPFLDAALDPTSEWDCLVWRVDGPGLPVTLTLEIAPGIVYTRENPIGPSDAGNGGGSVCYLVWGPGWGPIDFAPGATVTLQSPTWEGSVVVADVSWQIDAGNDEVSGEAPPGDLEVAVSQWQAGEYPVHGSAVQTAMAASPYSVQFASFDVRDGAAVQVRHFDPSTGFATNPNWLGNLTTQYFEVRIYGTVTGSPPSPDEMVTATLYAADGTELASTSDDRDDDPWRFELSFGELWLGDETFIEPGHWVTVTSEGGWTAGLQVPELTVQADEDTDLIWGEGPKALLFVRAGDVSQFTPVDGFVVDTAFWGYDLQKFDNVVAQYQAVNGDRVSQGHEWPRMGVFYSYEEAAGIYNVGHTFWITVTDGDGTPKAHATATTTPYGTRHRGAWSNGFLVEQDDWSDPLLDIQPGDRLHYRADDGYSNTVLVGTITARLNAAANTVAGTITAPEFVEPLECGAGQWGWFWQTFTVDPNGGSYLVDFSPFDLLPGTEVSVDYGEPDGDGVGAEFKVPRGQVYLPLVLKGH